MAQKSNFLPKTTPLHLWTAKVKNASRAWSALSSIMLEPWIISYSSALVSSDNSRPPPHNAPMKPSTKFWITAPLKPHMALSIALATWSPVHILMQGSTMRSRDAAEPERIFSSLKTTPCPDGTDPCEHLQKSLNLSCPLLPKQN